MAETMRSSSSSAGVKKLIRSKSGMRIICFEENEKSPFELSEPPWIADSECLHCMNCHVRFDLLKRRHHCRRCGRIFCSKCCLEKLPLPRMCFIDPVRLCSNSCLEVTRKENEFYEKQLKILITGAIFELSNNQISPKNHSATYLCKLSQDQRFIIFECGFPGRDPLQMATIQNVKVIRNSDEECRDFILDVISENTTNGVCIRYDDFDGEIPCELTLTVGVASNRLQSVTWISAILRAVKMIFESRRQLE